jgi:tetratricopeptide (TPR) repeat protein
LKFLPESQPFKGGKNDMWDMMRAAAHGWKRCGAALLCLALAVFLGGCDGRTADTVKIADAYIDGYVKLYEQGNDYTKQGLQIQADYAYGWTAASVSAMRYCVDCLLYLKGEGQSLEDVVDGRMGNWDEIAALNYASPYPWYFEGLVCNTQGKNDAARSCYEKALLNPAFSAEHDEALSVLHVMPVGKLKSVKSRLTELEDKIFAVYEPEHTAYPRGEFGFSDSYLRTLARESLAANPSDYRGALQHYEAALKVNPFEGDNFAGCALMHLYLGESDEAFFYVNEGLFVDPEHEGLNKIAATLNGEA